MKTYGVFITVVLNLLLLEGCVHQSASTIASSNHRFVQQGPLYNLKNKYTQIIRLGDELRLVLPTHQVFINQSAHINPVAFASLKEIVTLLNQTKNFGINILVYTPSLRVEDDFRPRVTLEQQQARSVMEYLLQYGLKTRIITATAWQGVSVQRKQSTGRFQDDAPGIFSLEIRTRLLEPEESE